VPGRRERKSVSRPVSRVLYGPRRTSDAAAIPLGRPLPAASGNQPGRRTGNRPGALASAVPPLFGFAPGGVCPAVRVTASAVRSYRTLSPLPPGQARRRSAFCGTVPGVAPAGRYPAPCFHGARTFLSGRNGPERPPGRLTRRIWMARPGTSRPVAPARMFQDEHPR
jgi:hypothetical protein